ncbi:MAG: protein kinase domain-containing protein, partial [Mycobacteriales bacterium]
MQADERAAVSEPRLAVGAVLVGRYELVRQIGRGAMGAVWEATDAVLGRNVAIKTISPPPGMPADECDVIRTRARREARTVAVLSHPSVVTVYDVVELEPAGDPCIVMELVRSVSLAETLRRHGPLRPHRLAEVGVAVAGALHAAHDAGIVHRDVKPSNVLLADDGRIKLTDFGIARAADDSAITANGMLVGPPSYVPPEVAQGAGAGPAADLWGLGATLYAGAFGQAAFHGSDPIATLHRVVSEPTPPTAGAGPLGPLIEALLRKDPAERPDLDRVTATLRELAAAGDRTDPGRTRDTGHLEQTDHPRSAGQVDHPRRTRRTVHSPPFRDAGHAGDVGYATVTVPAAPLHAGDTAVTVPATPRPSAGAGTDPLPPGHPSSPGVPANRPRPGFPRHPALPPPAPKRSRRGLAAAIVVALAVAAGGGAYAVVRHTAAGNQAGRAPGSSLASPSPARQTPGGREAVSPIGYQPYDGDGTFTVDVPVGWQSQQVRTGVVDLRAPTGDRFLRLVTGPAPTGSLVDGFLGAAKDFDDTHTGYHEIRIEQVAYRDFAAAEWEFTYIKDGVTRHVLYRSFVASGHTFGL